MAIEWTVFGQGPVRCAESIPAGRAAANVAMSHLIANACRARGQARRLHGRASRSLCVRTIAFQRYWRSTIGLLIGNTTGRVVPRAYCALLTTREISVDSFGNERTYWPEL